jgi:ComF family protein
MIDWILNILFPVACVICKSQVFERRYSAVCPHCWDALTPITPPICPKCGMPAPAIEGWCRRCRKGDNVFDYARSAVFFNDPAREIVHHLKYSDRVSLAKPIGRILRVLYEKSDFAGNLVLPVPLHRTRERSRGYNQAESIAVELGLPVDARLLRRSKKTAPQSGLSRSERSKNLASAFELRGDVKGLKVILVDDVFTTGATMNEISKVLKRGKVERVEVLTFARVPDDLSLQ